MVAWIVLVASPIIVAILGRRFAKHLKLGLLLIAAVGMLIIGFIDALIADRWGEDHLFPWALLAYLVGGAIVSRRDQPLFQLSFLFFGVALALALAYLFGGAATGVGWACWQSCDATTRIDELVVASWALAVLLLTLWIVWAGARAIFRRFQARSSPTG